MRILHFIILSFTLISVHAFGAEGRKTYISAFYGVAKTTSDVSSFNELKGKTMGGSLGFHLSKALALELSGRKTSFEETSTTLDLSSLGMGSVTSSTKMDALLLSAGLRIFFIKFFNVSFGLGYCSVNPNNTISATDPLVAAAAGGTKGSQSGLGYYYGGGIQIPLGAIDLFGDYTINKFSSDVTSNEMTGGLRLRF